MQPAASFVRTLAACTLLVSVSRAGDPPSLIGLGDLPGGDVSSTALGMSADGKVVCGYSSSATGDQAFIWTAAGGMVGLGDLPGGGTQSHARGISADGTTIVGDAESANGLEAFRWTAANGMVGLGDLPGAGFHSIANAVSANGSVVVGEGQSTLSGALGTEAFRWTSTTGMQGLGDWPGANFASVATGVSADGLRACGYGTTAASGTTGTELMMWEVGTGMHIFGDEEGGSFDSKAFSITPDGVSMTGTTSTDLGTQAAKAAKNYTGDKWFTSWMLDLPGGIVFGEGRAITRAVLPSMEVVVGRSVDANGMRAYMWTTNASIQSLETMLTTVGLDLGGWTLECATGVSVDATTITGYGTNPSGQQEAWVAFLGNVWTDVGGGLAGVNGVPKLTGEGVALMNHGHVLKLTGAKPSSFATTVVGLSALNTPFKGGTMVPSPLVVISGVPVGPTGAWTPVIFAWTPQISGFSMWMQVWIQDAAAAKGWSASNGIKATAP